MIPLTPVICVSVGHGIVCGSGLTSLLTDHHGLISLNSRTFVIPPILQFNEVSNLVSFVFTCFLIPRVFGKPNVESSLTTKRFAPENESRSDPLGMGADQVCADELALLTELHFVQQEL
jgi:hypothetical protein